MIHNRERYSMYKSNERNQKRKADVFGCIKLEDSCVLKSKPKTSKKTTIQYRFTYCTSMNSHCKSRKDTETPKESWEKKR